MLDPIGWKCSFDNNVTSQAETTEECLGRRGRKRRKDLGNVGWPLINQLERFCFKHEAKKFLVWFCLEDDGFSVESIIKKNFIWSKVSEAFVSKDEAIVDVADVTDEQMVVGKELMECNGPDLL